jgi:hypothetical protein
MNAKAGNEKKKRHQKETTDTTERTERTERLPRFDFHSNLSLWVS